MLVYSGIRSKLYRTLYHILLSDYNNSYVYTEEFADATGCVNTTAKWCASHHGGWFVADDSDSYKLRASVTAAGGNEAEQQTNASFSNWMTENFTITSNTTLSHFPIGNPRVPLSDSNYRPQAVFGLDAGSTLLNALKNGGHIGARVWSMFWGLTGATASTKMDGSFIFGGYDAAKVSGKPYNYSIGSDSDSTCKYMITIEDMILNFPNGSTSSLFDGVQSQLMQACIDTSFPNLMTLPYNPYFFNFESMSGMVCSDRSLGVNYYGILCDADDRLYAGDLTIKLQSGLEVKITNDQLLAPNVAIADDGSLVEDNSVKELIINSIQDVNAKDLPYIGRQFFSAAYMMTNLESNTFTLWAANPTTDEEITALDENGEPGTSVCSQNVDANSTTNTTTPSSSSTVVANTPSGTSAAASDESGSGSNAGLSTAAIAGVVIGVVAGVVAAGALLFFVVFRNRRRQNASPPAYDPGQYDMQKVPSPQEVSSEPRLVELRGSEPQELYGSEVHPGAYRNVSTRSASTYSK
ncbi:hypothetical protein SLS54_005294 [Diplodia seriata]